MGKLMLRIDGEPLQFDGTVDEIVEFIKILRHEKVPFAANDEEKQEMRELAEEKSVLAHVRQHMPSVGEIKSYILSQPEYTHSTFDIQRHFFARTFKARGASEGVFHEFLKLATEARKLIIQEKGGQFMYDLKLGRHKKYHWIPSK